MNNAIYRFTQPTNESELEYLPGSPEKKALKQELRRQYESVVEVPCVIGGERVYTGNTIDMIMPDEKAHVLGRVHLAGEKELAAAKLAALKAHEQWEELPYEHRAGVFLRAAELVMREPHHNRITAATMLNQAKTIVQTEGDVGSGLADIIRYDVYNASLVYQEQPCSTPGTINRVEWRPLEGFVAAITPFNYVSDAANLAIAPAVAGNTVLWKPSSVSVLSNYYVMEALMEAGLPAGVINFVPSRGSDFSRYVLPDKALAGVHFIGSTYTFQNIWETVANNILGYKNYPRLAGETGGKNYMLVCGACDVDALVTALIKGAFELSGQKCSSTSRAYIPKSMWPETRNRLLEEIAKIKVGPATDFRNFISAVIDETSFRTIKGFIDEANRSDEAEVLCGSCDDAVGFFVTPTVIECKDPLYRTMTEEIFGPVLSVYVYDDEKLDEVLGYVDGSTKYALTGAVFCQDRDLLAQLERKLRYTCGNMYLNDKSTGSMAGYIPFGGGRLSGTNDKPGSMINMLKWVTPRTIKDNLVPSKCWSYGSMEEE